MTSATTRPTATLLPTSRRVRMLVADDSSIARQSIAAYLRTVPEVDLLAVCENGQLAVEAALRNEPDVVLLDLQMPVMSGLEAAEILRKSMPHVGVILTSVHDNGEVRATCLAGGADAFIGKATIPALFTTVLTGVLELRRAPERHLRAARFQTASLLDLFADPLPSRHVSTSTPVGRPGCGKTASGPAIR